MNIFKIRKPKLFDYSELLPSQPLPDLKETILQYLNSCRSVKTETEMKNLVEDSKEFLRTHGPKFQQELEHHSWTEVAFFNYSK